MAPFTTKVSEKSLLRQTVLNTSQSIELLREAVSNSVDASARNIDIKLTNVGGEMWNIVIQDDGNGMDERHLHAFFNAGESEKDYPQQSIGEKGLGSKTTFVAKRIQVESRRFTDPQVLRVATMDDPLAAIHRGEMPTYTLETSDSAGPTHISTQGSRIILSDVHLTSFNGKKSDDPDEIAARVLHYLRSMCATGTIKNRHAQEAHIIGSVMNVGVLPMVTVEVVTSRGSATLGPVPGVYQVPSVSLNPSGGTPVEGVPQNSKKFCDVYDFNRSRTISIMGDSVTVHYDGTVIIAGESVRQEMLKDELKQGWTQKSQMGVHLCKDFIPLHNDASLSRELLGGEYYFEYKLFLNSQHFQLNADRNVITNEESDEVAWIWADFKENVWPSIESRAQAYKNMKANEDAAIDAIKRTNEASALKTGYVNAPGVTITKEGASLEFVKEPKKEADVSHLLAMMVQSGYWAEELAPISKFGQYIDASTDILVEDSSGTALLVEVETRLDNLFRHQHPMTSYDLVVVWSLGRMSNLMSREAPWGVNNSVVSVILQETASGGWELKWGTNSRPVIVLSEIL